MFAFLRSSNDNFLWCDGLGTVAVLTSSQSAQWSSSLVLCLHSSNIHTFLQLLKHSKTSTLKTKEKYLPIAHKTWKRHWLFCVQLEIWVTLQCLNTCKCTNTRKQADTHIFTHIPWRESVWQQHSFLLSHPTSPHPLGKERESPRKKKERNQAGKNMRENSLFNANTSERRHKKCSTHGEKISGTEKHISAFHSRTNYRQIISVVNKWRPSN